MASVSQRRRRRRKRDARATGRWEGADGGGSGQPGPEGAATKHTEQSTHQAAIRAALVYAGQCLAKGRKVTLTVESVTALRNLHTAPTDASNPQEEAARGETSAHPPQRQGAARPAESNGNKRQRGPTRGPTSRGGGTATAGRAQEAPRLPVRH